MNAKRQFVIGIDGGGTKTIAALADSNGKILKIAKAGPSAPHNVGKEKSVSVVSGLIGALARGKRVSTVFAGLADAEEDKKAALFIKKEVLKIIKIPGIELLVGSDQIVAFRSGTGKKDGVALIAGTGCVAHGWKGNKGAKANGWGWPADEGSAFWVGQKAFQETLKELDGRRPETLLARLVLRKFGTKDAWALMSLVYPKKLSGIIPEFAVICDEANRKGDKVARSIMTEAGEELALSAKTVIKKLNFQKEKFPLVLAGSMFKSNILLGTVKKGIKKFAPRAEFIRPKTEPVLGAVKLAVENLEKKP